jgi:hypothetical protein
MGCAVRGKESKLELGADVSPRIPGIDAGPGQVALIALSWDYVDFATLRATLQSVATQWTRRNQYHEMGIQHLNSF